MTKDPIEAFEWLVEQFRQYTCNQQTWMQTREVLRDAEALRDAFQAEQAVTKRIIEAARDISEIMHCASQSFPSAQLDGALREYDSLVEKSA